MAAEIEKLLIILRTLRPEIATRYKARQVEFFGSYARGEQTTASDIDLLVDFAEEADLFDLVGLAQFLEDRLQRPVDIIPRNALRVELRDSVLSEVVPV